MDIKQLRNSLRSWLSAKSDPMWENRVFVQATELSKLTKPDRPHRASHQVCWPAPAQCTRALSSVADVWLDAQPTAADTSSVRYTTEDELSEVQWEVWSGMRRLQPMPDVAIACGQTNSDKSIPLGVLWGHPNYAGRHFFISHVALHPALRTECPGIFWHNDEGQRVCETLVEAAIDRSQQMDCHGWVACTPAPDEEAAWQRLKFYRHDAMTFRRMGYFGT